MTDEQKPKPFRVETTVDADRELVWRAMSDPEQVREWFGWDYEDIEAEIRYIFVDHAELNPPSRIDFGNGSYIELEDRGTRTVVRAVMPGPLDDAEWADLYDGVEEGWRVFFEQLRFLLERRPEGARRTVYLSGEATGADVVAVAGAGDAWHESRYARMTVDSRGHLIAATSQAPFDAPSPSPSPSPASITVTTYGLTDDAFDRLRSEWAERWATVAADAKVTTDTGEAPATARH